MTNSKMSYQVFVIFVVFFVLCNSSCFSPSSTHFFSTVTYFFSTNQNRHDSPPHSVLSNCQFKTSRVLYLRYHIYFSFVSDLVGCPWVRENKHFKTSIFHCFIYFVKLIYRQRCMFIRSVIFFFRWFSIQYNINWAICI